MFVLANKLFLYSKNTFNIVNNVGGSLSLGGQPNSTAEQP